MSQRDRKGFDLYSGDVGENHRRNTDCPKLAIFLNPFT